MGISEYGSYNVSLPGPNVAGVLGLSGDSGNLAGIGVGGASTDGVAISGTDLGSGVGTSGASVAGYGVVGTSTKGDETVAGVLGQAGLTGDLAGVGVQGRSTNGTGVVGSDAGNGVGVDATSRSGVAVSAHIDSTTSNADVKDVSQAGLGAGLNVETTLATNGSPAINATSGSAAAAVKAFGKFVPKGVGVPEAGNELALLVYGVSTFTRSGAVGIAAGTESVVVAVPGGLSATSHVLATLQTNAGTVAVRAAVPDPAAGEITIYLTSAPTVVVQVGWFVFDSIPIFQSVGGPGHGGGPRPGL